MDTDSYDEDTGYVRKNDAKKVEMALMIEDEVSRLQRQYRVLERNRSDIRHCGPKPNRKYNVLNKLRSELRNVRTDLAVADGPAPRLAADKTVNRLKQLVCEHGDYRDNIGARKKWVKEIDGQIRMTKKEMVKIKMLSKTTDSMHLERILYGQSRIRRLENKLEASTNRFCMIHSENKKLRDEINHLLIERNQFNKAWEHYISQLAASKRYVMDIIEQSSLALNQTEELSQKVEALHRKAFTDCQQHAETMHSYEVTMTLRKVRDEFLETKAQHRVSRRAAVKAQMKQERLKMELQNTSAEYRQILEDILEFGSGRDVPTIILEYAKTELHNFNMVDYCSILQKEKEYLTDNIAVLRHKIDEQISLTYERKWHQTQHLEKLNAQVKSLIRKNEVFESVINVFNTKLEKVFTGVVQLFTTLGCDVNCFQHLLGQENTKYDFTQEEMKTVASQVLHDLWLNSTSLIPDRTVNEFNIILYLGELESNIAKLLKHALWLQSTKKTKNIYVSTDDKVAAIPLKIDSIMTPCPICFESGQINSITDEYVLVRSRIESIKWVTRKEVKRLFTSVEHNVENCGLPQATLIMKNRYN